MRSRVLWRRSATAIGVYIATVLGFLTTVVATRELGVGAYAKFAAVFAATIFFQVLFDLTFEEALIKYGFRYTESERWGACAGSSGSRFASSSSAPCSAAWRWLRSRRSRSSSGAPAACSCRC